MVRDPQIDALSSTNSDDFFLSKPIKINLTVNKSYLNVSNMNNTNNTNEFTFLQPLIAERGLFKSTRPKINIRSQPYSIKPVNNNKNEVKKTTINTTENSNNAVLARLSSISSTFKSMFVRPKQGKSIDISSLFNKKSKNTNTPTSTTSNSPESIGKNDLKINQSVNDYLIKLCSRDNQIGDSSYLTERIKKISKEVDQNTYTASSSTIKGSSMITSDTGASMTKWTCLVCLSKHTNDIKICSICGSSKTQSHSAAASSYGGSSAGSVLNESLVRPFQVKSLPSSTKTSLLNFNTRNLFETSTSSSVIGQTLSSKSPQEQTNQLKSSTRLKTWTCQFCNFANDNLKVVCMNCRSSKSSSSTAKIDLKEATKRNRGELSPISSNSSYASSVIGEDTASQLAKRLKNNECQVCSTCSQKETQRAQPLSLFSDSTTPIKPNFDLHGPKENLKQTPAKEPEPQTKQPTDVVPLSALFKSTSTWSCPTCLASNSNDKMTCACCQTSKPASKLSSDVTKETSKPIQTEITSSTNSSTVPLSALFKNNSTWSCTTCLASNPTDKTSCACCQTPKPGAKIDEAPKKTDPFENKTSGLQFPAGFSTSSTSTSSTFSFGKPVDSTSGSKISFTSSGFSLGNKPADDKQITNDTPKITFGAPTSSGISFGLPKPAETSTKPTEEASKATFSFGTKPVESITETQKQAFSFGTTKPVEEATKSTFSFGAPKPAEEVTKPSISFGTSKSNETAKETSNSVFSFGAPKSTEETSKPAFSFGSTSINVSTEPKSTFVLGSSTTNASTAAPTFTTNSLFSSAAPTVSTQSSSGLFTSSSTAATSTPLFGAQASSSTTSTQPLFGSSSTTSIFGNNKTENKPLFGSSTVTTVSNTPTTGTFSFGSQPPTTASTTTSSNSMFGQTNGTLFSSTAAPSFNFTSSTAPSTTSSSTFSFGQQSTSSSTAPTSTFSFGSASTQPSTITSSQAPTFSFGNQTATTTQTTAPSFPFGSSSNSTTTSQPFVFGQTQTNQQSQDLFSNANKRANTEPSQVSLIYTQEESNLNNFTLKGFNFNNAPSFNFTSTPAIGTPTPGAAPFVFGGGAPSDSATSQTGTPRAIKKGARRLGPGRR